MNLLKDILLQLLFLFLPIITYYHVMTRFRPTLSEFKRQFTVFLYCSLSVILCLRDPIEISESFSYDLAIIPIIIAILYGGFLSGALTIIVFFLSPFYLWGTMGSLATYFTIPILVLLLSILRPKWKELTRRKKYIFAFILAFIKLSLLYGYFLFQHGTTNPSPSVKESIFSITWIGIIPIFSMLLLIYIIEYYFDVEQLQKQLNHMRRLQHVSNLAKEVSEEVHKPLMIIKGFTQLLGAEHNKVNKEYVPIILSELDRAEAIIASYINLAKPDPYPTRSLSSKELIENVLDILRTYASNNQVSFEELQVRNLRLRGNMDLLSESFTSIIKYFIDANHPSKGKIFIKNYLKGNDVIFELIDMDGKIKNETLQILRNYQFFIENSQNEQLKTAFSILFAHNGNLLVKRKFFKGYSIIITLPAYVKKRSPVNHKVASS